MEIHEYLQLLNQGRYDLCEVYDEFIKVEWDLPIEKNSRSELYLHYYFDNTKKYDEKLAKHIEKAEATARKERYRNDNKFLEEMAKREFLNKVEKDKKESYLYKAKQFFFDYFPAILGVLIMFLLSILSFVLSTSL